MRQPCRGCADRAVGCHGKCERYIKYRARLDLAKRLKEKETEARPSHVSKLSGRFGRTTERKAT